MSDTPRTDIEEERLLKMCELHGAHPGPVSGFAIFARQLERENRELAATQRCPEGWRPIETAPKDGTHILAKPCAQDHMRGNQQTPPYVCHWFDCGIGAAWVLSSGDNGIILDPMYWMPLQVAPQPKEAQYETRI